MMDYTKSFQNVVDWHMNSNIPFDGPVEESMTNIVIGFGNIPPEKAPSLVKAWFLKNPEKAKILKSREAK